MYPEALPLAPPAPLAEGDAPLPPPLPPALRSAAVPAAPNFSLLGTSRLGMGCFPSDHFGIDMSLAFRLNPRDGLLIRCWVTLESL